MLISKCSFWWCNVQEYDEYIYIIDARDSSYYQFARDDEMCIKNIVQCEMNRGKAGKIRASRQFFFFICNFLLCFCQSYHIYLRKSLYEESKLNEEV